MSDPFINIDMGPCCACGCDIDGSTRLVCLPEKAPMPGTGWGCTVCGLGPDGALAVICNTCLVNQAEIRYAIDGYATGKQRIERSMLHERHEHNEELHQLEDKRIAWRKHLADARIENRLSGNGHKTESGQNRTESGKKNYRRHAKRRHR